MCVVGVAPQRSAPAALPEGERCFFLCACDRNTEIVVSPAIAAIGCGLHRGANQLGHPGIGQWLGLDAQVGGRCVAGRDDLQRADAVASDFAQQRVRVGRSHLVASCHSLADVFAVRQQVLKIKADNIPLVRAIARRKGQRQRQRPAQWRGHPFVVVLQDISARLDAPSAHKEAIHPQPKGLVAARGRAHGLPVGGIA